MIWISHNEKCIFLKPRSGYEKVEFNDYESLLKYIFKKISEGYLIG